MKVRLAALALLALVGYGGFVIWQLTHVPSNEAMSRRAFGKAPPGLPPTVVDGNSVYAHAREVSNLPRGAEMVGTAAGHGIMYDLATGGPKEVWVTKNGHVWQYTFLSNLNLP